MAKRNTHARPSILLDLRVEQELAPIFEAGFNPQVALLLSDRQEQFNARGIFFYKRFKVVSHKEYVACIRFYPYPLPGSQRYQMEVYDYPSSFWQGESDTAEQAVKVSVINARRIVAAERAAYAERLAAYRRQRAEASA